MVTNALAIIKTAVTSCVAWTAQLFNALGAGGIIVSAFLLVLIVGMFLMPLRGAGVTPPDAAFADFVQGSVYRGKFTGSRKTSSGYKGKYESRSRGGHRATPKK